MLVCICFRTSFHFYWSFNLIIKINGSYFTQIIKTKVYHICFLYYLSVYVKSFKELFLLLLRGMLDFSKASAKVLTIFQPTKYFKKKNYCFNIYLIITHIIFHYLPFLETLIALLLNTEIKWSSIINEDKKQNFKHTTNGIRINRIARGIETIIGEKR